MPAAVGGSQRTAPGRADPFPRGYVSVMARSALNLRLVLAGFGAVVCTLLGLLVWNAVGLGPALVLFLLAVVAVVDLVVVQRRRTARARAHAGQDHRHDSLFE